MIGGRWLVAALASEAIVMMALAVVTLDLWAHRRVEMLGGVNVWGYRGAVAQQKRPNEIRIAVTGGDLAFGWGQAAGGTLAPQVAWRVTLVADRPGAPLHPITAVNLAAQGLRPAEYPAWLERFASLQPDVVCIVADPPTYRSRRASPVPDRTSGVFAMFGYAPILPLVLEEKGAVSGSRILRGTGRALAAADHALFGFIHRLRAGTDDGAPYSAALAAAVRSALGVGAAVVLVMPPHYAAGDAREHEAVAAMVSDHMATDRRVRFIDLASEAGTAPAVVRLNDLDFASDGIAWAAESIAKPVVDLVRPRIE